MTKTYVHRGIVVDTESPPSLAGLRVEVWDAAQLIPDIIGYAFTDALGHFELQLHEQDVAELFVDRPPEVYFRVFDPPAMLLKSTVGEQTWRLLDPPGTTRIIVNTRGGMMAAAPLSVVRGRALDANAGPLSGTVKIFDVRIGGGDVLVGNPTLDASGRYERIYDPTSALAEGKLFADLYVLHEESGALSEVRYHAGPTTYLDVIASGEADRGLPEQSTLGAAMEPILGSTAAKDVADEQIETVAASTRRSIAEVRAVVKAASLSDEISPIGAPPVDEEVLYGLLRQGLPEDRAGLLQIPQDQLREALERAMDARQINELDSTALDGHLAKLRDASVALAKEGTASLDAILALVLTTPADRDTFLSLYSEHEGTIAQFWTALAAVGSPFSTPSLITHLQYLLQLAALGRYFLPFITELNSRHVEATSGWTTLRDLAAHDEASWISVILDDESVGVPSDESLGGNLTERKANYAALIARTLESWLSTRAIAGRVKAAAPDSDLDKFFVNNVVTTPSFEFGVQRVEAFWGDAVLTGIGDPTATKATLKKMERLFRVAPRHEEMQALLDGGFSSAGSIVRYGKGRFIADYASALGGEYGANAVYAQAKAQAAAATQLHLLFNPGANGPTTTYSQDYQENEALSDPLIDDWTALFGKLDGTTCDPCASAYSPAAYLVDLLLWLGQHNSEVATGGGGYWTAKELLLGGDKEGATEPGRRPDIGNLVLSCTNTERTLPYVDLVMELLETRVDSMAAPAPIETLLPAEDLLVAPQYLDAAAYDTLATAYYPWSLPYSLWHQQIRVHLDHLGVPRYRLMEALQRTADPSALAIAQERLGMTNLERAAVVNEASMPWGTNVWQLWGFASAMPGGSNWYDALTLASQFLASSGLSYDELRELLDSGFMASFTAGGQPTLERDAGYEGSEPEHLTITGLTGTLADVWTAVQGLLRLRGRLGWAIRELDKVKTALSAGALDDAFIETLADVAALSERFNKLPLERLAAWWADLDTQRTPALDELSLYEALFLDDAWSAPVAPAAFALPLSGSDDIADHLDHVLGAIGMRASDYALLTSAEEAGAQLRLLPALGVAEPKVNLSNLSRLFRLASLAQALKISLADLVTLQALSGLAPLNGDASANPTSPAQTRLFLEQYDKLASFGLTIAQTHYLLRHVTRPGVGVLSEEEAVALRVGELDAGLANIVADTSYGPDPNGETLQALLETVISSERPELTHEQVAAQVATVMAITDGSSALTISARRAQLDHIIGPYVSDLTAIEAELLFVPYEELSSVQLWLQPDKIQLSAAGTHVIGWDNLAGPATVELPPVSLLPACVAWLRADLGITLNGSDVSGWTDLSSAGTHAAQATGAKQPAFVASGPGGLATVDFDGSASVMDLDAISSGSNSLTAVALIVQRNEGSGPQQLVAFGSANMISPVTAGAAVGGYDGTGTLATGAASSGTQLLSWVVEQGSSTMTCYRNGVAIGEVSYDGSWSWAETTRLGALGDSDADYFDGQLSELALFDAKLSDGARQFVERYMLDRYGMIDAPGPRYVPAGSGPFGLPAVAFEGGRDALSLSLAYAETSHTFVCLLRQASLGRSGGMALLDAESGPLVCALETTGASGQLGFVDGDGWSDVAASETGDQIVSWVFDSAGSCAVYRDGVQLGSSSGYGSAVALGGVVGLGGRLGSDIEPFDGQIALAALFNEALSDSQLARLHGYLLTLAGQPPESRFAVVEQALLDFVRLRDARAFIKQSLANALDVSAELASELLTRWLVAPSDDGQPLIVDLLPPTHAQPVGLTSYQRRAAVVRFSKAATVARHFGINAADLAWLQGPLRDTGWLDLNALPLSAPASDVFDSNALAPIQGQLELPGWLSVSCATTAPRTAQASASSVNGDLGPTAARALSVDGNSWALLVEPATTNLVTEQDLAQWTASGTPLLTDAFDPAGTNAAVELADQDDAVQQYLSRAVTVGEGSYTVSAWSQLLAPASSAASLPLLASTPNLEVPRDAVDDGWAYRSFSDTITTGGSPELRIIPRNTAADQGAVRIWGLQLEARAYPTSFIGADNASFSRAADVVAIDPAQLDGLDSGFFRLTLRFAPLYAHDQTAGDHDLLYIDSNNRLFFDKSASAIVLRINMVDVASAPLTFSRHQLITVEAVHADDGVSLTVSGCSSGNGTQSGALQPAISAWPASVYLLGNSSGAQEGAALWQLRIEAPARAEDLPAARQRFAELLRLGDMIALNNKLSGSDRSLFDLLETTTGPNPASEAEFLAALAEQARWSLEDLTALAGASIGHNLTYPDDYRSDIELGKLAAGMEPLLRLGASAQAAISWLDVNANSAGQQAVATAVLKTARARHGDSAWPAVARPLRDELRQQQQAQLVAYLVHSGGLASPDALYDELLVDVEMTPCAQTSRMVQAISSVQLFIHRILLGLEQVQLDKEAREQWRWRKNYRVWEANRKILLYPENWIEPELRDNKTPLFEALEAELRQSPVTDQAVEAAYRNYLAGLDAIARLDVVGVVHHKQAATPEYAAIDELHVFARTPGQAVPHQLYHRIWVDRQRWTPWVEVPIEASTPVFLPVLEYGRLRLHWLSIVEMDVPTENSSYKKIRIELLTSHYRDGRWSPQQRSNAIENTALTNVSRFLLVHERGETDSSHSFIRLYYDINLVASAKFDPCSGSAGALERPLSSIIFDSDLQWSRPRSSTPKDGHYTLPNSGFGLTHWTGPVKVLELPDGVAGTMQVEHFRIVNLIGPQFQPIETFFLHADNRVLFGYLDPFPSESEPPGPYDGQTSAMNANEVAPIAKPTIPPEFVQSHVGLNDIVIAHEVKTKDRPDFTAHIRPFSHPYVCQARTALHRFGLDGLRRYDALPAADPADDPLQETNEPFFAEYVPPVVGYVSTPYPIDEFEFGYGGAYSEYNWELFFHVPLLLASWLKRAGRYEQALSWLRAIFDPTDGESSADPIDVWRFKPFRDLQSVAALQADVTSGSPTTATGKWLKQLLGGGASDDMDASLQQQLTAWQNDPFNPHLIARMRPSAYQKASVRLYIETLIAWGDQLFMRDSIESIVEAQQLYMLARRILGERPMTYAPPRTTAPPPVPKTFNSLEHELEELETLVPLMPTSPGGVAADALASFGVGGFCVPHNDAFVKLWDTVEDRLYKIRHCMNIAGVVRQLPLFQPPIDPALLVKAKAAGLDLDSVLDQLSAPPPLYRFPVLYGRALDFSGYLVGLGGALLAALEKGDGEQLSLLRSNHELSLLELVKETRKAQLAEAEAALEALNESRLATEARRTHYVKLIEDGLIDGEEKALGLASSAKIYQVASASLQAIGSALNAIPQSHAGVPCSGVEFGGTHVGAILSGLAAAAGGVAGYLRDEASMEATTAGYTRREQDWTLQRTLAEHELAQIDKQIIAAEIRVDIAGKELTSHELQINQSREMNDFVENKFTNQQLYLWMAGKLSELYFQAYKLAFAMARRAERAYQAERAEPDAYFIKFGYWDGLRKGLLAGEQLQLDLRRMDAAYLETDRREYELTKAISFAEQFPAQLIALRETGAAEIELPEGLFDLDYPGHYLRRIKNVSLTLPAVTGPYSSVNCTLTLLSGKIRRGTLVAGGYSEQSEDSRFDYHFGQVRSVCTSSGVGDSGMFELSFRDDRRLPFEGAGAVSRWRIELPQLTNRFELRSLTDVVLQMQYTARDGGGQLRDAARSAALNGLLPRAQRLISAANEHAAAWSAFETVLDGSNNQLLTLNFEDGLPFVPGRGAVRMRNLYLALDIDHANPASVILDVSVAPAGSADPVKLFDGALGLARVDYESDPVDTSATSWTFTIAQATIVALPADMKQEYPPSSGIYRLHPTVLRDLILVLDLERDAPLG